MKNKTLIIIFLLLAIGIVAWSVSRNQKTNKDIIPTPFEGTGPQNNTVNSETITLSSEKPASFAGVEIKKYHSQFGYEIEYPAHWKAKDITDVYGNSVLSAYEIQPRNIVEQETGDPSIVNQIAVITVEKKTLKDLTEEIESGKNLFIDKTAKLSPTTIQGEHGWFLPLRYPSARYFFEKNKKLYSIVFLYDPMMGVSKEEALWILSTFKIVE